MEVYRRKTDDPYRVILERINTATGCRTQQELARILEIRQSSISDSKRRNSIPALWFLKLYDIFGINPDWLRTGEGPVYLKERGKVTLPESVVSPRTDATIMDVFEISPEGVLLPSGRLPLPANYVSESSMVIKCADDSFAPTIRAGALVGIDTAYEGLSNGDIFAINGLIDGFFRRLFLSGKDGQFLLRSDNPCFPETRMAATTCLPLLLGRVRWIWQNL